MAHRAGGKINARHTTLIDLAAKVVDIVANLGVVTKISLGIIKTGAGATGGTQRVKITASQCCILLTVRQSGSVQEIRAYNGNVQVAIENIARALRNDGISICFRRD